MDAQQLSTLFDLFVQALAIISPGLAIYAMALKKGKDELVRLLDNSPVQNQSLKNLALNMGLKHATKAIQKLR